MKEIKLAYTRLHFNGLMPEIMLFDNIPNVNVEFVGTITKNIYKLEYSKYVSTEIKKLLPDTLSCLVMRKPYSPVSFVKLQNLEQRIKDVEVINSAELYSFVSHQCADIAMKTGKRLVISVWETISSLPVNYFPPHVQNVNKVKIVGNIFLAYTLRAKNYLLSLSVPNEKIEVIYPGVDLSIFKPFENNTDGKFRILYVGRYDEEKGLYYLLNAFSKLCKDKYDIELWIRAKKRTGRLLHLAQEFAKKYPIKFIDSIDYTKLPEIYNQCDVLCLPSYDKRKYGLKIWEEQFGFVLMEAMACGLPIITTDCGAIPEVVGQKNIIVKQKSIDELYHALYKIIKEDELRIFLSKSNRERAERLFDLKKQKSKLGRIIHNIV